MMAAAMDRGLRPSQGRTGRDGLSRAMHSEALRMHDNKSL